MPGKKTDKKSGGGKKMMAQMGLTSDMSTMMGGDSGDVEADDDDDDLEAELLALTGGSNPKKSSKKKVNAAELERMVTASMRDIPSDAEISDDEDEDALLAELVELEQEPDVSPISTPDEDSGSISSGSNIMSQLEDRLQMYTTARSNADASKARRIDRSIKTLNDLIKNAKAGKSIDESDIPPPVASGVKSPSQEFVPPPQAKEPSPPPAMFTPTLEPTSAPQPPVPPPKPVVQPPTTDPVSISSTTTDDEMVMLMTRKDQYKAAALEAKTKGDIDTAKNFIRIFKQFELVIEAREKGSPIDLSKMPPPPNEYKPPPPNVERNAVQGSASQNTASSPDEPEVPQISEEAEKKLFQAPESAGTVLEALQQRLDKYKTSADQAKAEGNGSKARRMGRIAKQYEDAVKCYKAGKPIDYDELPCPPGFPPIPTGASPKRQAPSSAPTAMATAATDAKSSTSSSAAVSHPQPAQEAPNSASSMAPVPQARPRPQRQLSVMSRAEQQTIFLQERQLGFKKIALKAKQNGQMELAKKYLRQAMGFNQMIEASQSGLPVDLTKIPALPGPKSAEALAFVPNPVEGEEAPKGDRNEIYKKLEQELIQQIRTATANSQRFTNLGDVSTATKFDKMSQNARKDLDALKNAYKHGDPVPRFHYETKSFSIVQCCPELGDNDLEIIIVRGINFGLPSDYEPKDLDTYVKYEFPYPTEESQKGHTETCKGTSNPEYDQSFKVQITRKSRGFLRLLKQASKPLKLEVYYKRGFFKGDKLLGTANVKLIGLETHCIVHESYDLTDTKHKSVGGKLEVKIRVRDPFVSKQVEEVTEKWLFIDAFERVLKPQPSAAPRTITTSGAAPRPAPRGAASQQPIKQSPSFTSIEVLKYEKQLLDDQIQRYKGRLKKAEEDALNERGETLLKKIMQTQQYLHEGGTNAWQSYSSSLHKSQVTYLEEAKLFTQQNKLDKAQVILKKKKLVEKELEGIQAKIPRK